ncbi:MAG: cell division protein ZipA [Pseudomonadota bacterium]|nr:cell division protein ZipA [Pseudomonadota bacterium]
MFEIVIFILVLLAAFIGVAWYARRSSQQRAMDLDLDHLEPEINLDNDFNDYFEHELQQQSIGDIDSEPSVSLSTAAEKIESELEPIINLEEKTAEPQVSTKKVQSTIDFVIDDDIEPIDETMASPADQQAVKSSSPRDNVERIRPTAVEAKPKSPRKDSDDLVIALTIMAPENERFAGRAVKAALESSNLHFGDLQVYHRFTGGARRQSIFSVANILDPGTLLPDKFISLTTPGLLIFARLPGPVNGLAMFDDLLETAQSLTEKLGGTLSDDTREPISESRLEAMRSRIFNLNFAIHNENHDYSN